MKTTYFLFQDQATNTKFIIEMIDDGRGMARLLDEAYEIARKRFSEPMYEDTLTEEEARSLY